MFFSSSLCQPAGIPTLKALLTATLAAVEHDGRSGISGLLIVFILLVFIKGARKGFENICKFFRIIIRASHFPDRLRNGIGYRLRRRLIFSTVSDSRVSLRLAPAPAGRRRTGHSFVYLRPKQCKHQPHGFNHRAGGQQTLAQI